MKTAFINGKIYINKDEFSEAMYVKDDIIQQLGSTPAILDLDPDQIIDLDGKTVLPGLNDSHLHLSVVGNSLSQLQLYGATSIEDIITRGREYLKHNPKENFIYGRGWNQDYFIDGEKRLLNKHDLDKISKDIPIICERVCVHVVSFNSKALELLDLDPSSTIDGGEIYLDSDGELLGIFTENAAIKVREIVPKDSPEDIERKFLIGADHALKNGLTSVQSCDIMMADHWEPMFTSLKNIYEEGKTRLRYYPQFNFNTTKSLEDYIDANYHQDIYNNYFQRGAIKLFKDGSLGARTALLKEPYNDQANTCGVEALSDDFMDKVCALAHREGIRVITHAIGDQAISKTLDSYEKFFNKKENTLRHGVVHCQITDPALLQRVADLNINVMFQPIFLEYDITMVEDRVGKDLASSSYAHKTLLKDLKVHTAYGTDAPVEDLNPFECMYSAVTRQRKDGFPANGFYPDERVTVEDAIDCYTIESAYCEGNEDIKGRLLPGYLADFIVLDRDIFTIKSNEIKDIKVDQTYIGGELVYKR